MKKTIPRIQEREGNEKKPIPKVWEREGNGKRAFPKFRNGKGMNKCIPTFRERESEAIILGHSREREREYVIEKIIVSRIRCEKAPQVVSA